MDVTIEQAYREACAAVGEATVTQRLMVSELARLTQENERLTAELAEHAPDPAT